MKHTEDTKHLHIEGTARFKDDLKPGSLAKCHDECDFLDKRDGGYCKLFYIKLGSSTYGPDRCRACIEYSKKSS